MTEQRVQHLLYEGEVEVWTEEDGQARIILRDGPHDLGDDLGDYLPWLLGPGRANGNGRCKLAKRLRLLIDDLEPDDTPERRNAEGDPPNLELAEIIRSTGEDFRDASTEQLAALRDQWQQLYRGTVEKARAAYFMAGTFELLTARAERKTRDG